MSAQIKSTGRNIKNLMNEFKMNYASLSVALNHESIDELPDADCEELLKQLTEIQSMNEEHSKSVLRADTETKTAMIKVLTRLNGKREQTGRKQRFDSGYAASAGSRALSERLSEAMQPTDQTQEMGHSDQPLSVSEHDSPIQEENISFSNNHFQS